MGKWEKYKKHFHSTWLTEPQFSKWLTPVKDDPTKAFCKYCAINLRAHKGDLSKHSKSDKHIKNSKAVTSKFAINKVFTPSTENKCVISALEIKLAVHIACHSSISTIDHLSVLLKNEIINPNNITLDRSLQLHRTKCTALITKVIAASLFREQVSDINDKQFALILDESTDVSTTKHLCICIRYYNSRKSRIITQYLGVIPVIETTALALHNHLKHFFIESGINLKNCFAIATDGGSNLCGCHNSLFTLMKKRKTRFNSFQMYLPLYSFSVFACV